ncbi:hypothetical protein Clacol_004454 [Clathrus columnatus]|uniref:Oxidoreductase-like domain-containing protein n=1 Tax=Clathrus columnatus TaxID=1419009 RepID=A0AAV5AC63_9AGAM|nr:hypothetical protein Clacol_004454 [Clathrus columnatus]
MFIPFSKCYKLAFRNKKAGLYRYHSSNHGSIRGRNWSARADFLTKSIRQRKDLDSDDRLLTSQHMIKRPETKRINHEIEVSNIIVDSALTLRTPVKMFRGMAIPEKPKPPGPDECCMSDLCLKMFPGCAICVYDLYITSLETYRDALDAIRVALQSQHVPISEWPDEIVKDPKINKDNEIQSQNPDVELDVSLSAFAELEKSLRLKRGAKNEIK